jgi:hypothetical protein
MNLKINSKWVNTALDIYIVNAVLLKEGNTWVQYTKVKTGVTYECLQEAFVYRFKEQSQ